VAAELQKGSPEEALEEAPEEAPEEALEEAWPVRSGEASLPGDTFELDWEQAAAAS